MSRSNSATSSLSRSPGFRRGRLHPRAAISMIELMMSLSSATIIMAGLATTVFLSNRSLQIATNSTATNVDSLGQISKFQQDLREATEVTAISSSRYKLKLPDRDNNGTFDEITYEWFTGENGYLTSTQNNITSQWPLGPIKTMSLSNVSRSVPALLPAGTSVEPTGRVLYQSHTRALTDNGRSLTLVAPGGAASGDILIAFVVVHKDGGNPSLPSGWTSSYLDTEGDITVRIAWRQTGIYTTATTFSWANNCDAIACIARFSGARANPLTAGAVQTGNSSTPPSPAITTTVNNTLVLRFMAAAEDDLESGEMGLQNERLIDMASSGTTTFSAPVSFILGAQTQPTAGDSGTDNFLMLDDEDFITFTIGIAP